MEGIVEPRDVIEFTQEFRKDSDIFTQFVDDCLQDSNNFQIGVLGSNSQSVSKDCITSFEEIYKTFEDWCADKNLSTKLYKKIEVKKMISDLF